MANFRKALKANFESSQLPATEELAALRAETTRLNNAKVRDTSLFVDEKITEANYSALLLKHDERLNEIKT